MLVYYSGWGYWEESHVDLPTLGGKKLSCFIDVRGLFELPKDAEMDIQYQGETTTDHLLAYKNSTIEEPISEIGGDIYFVLCDKPYDIPPDPYRRANIITKKYITADIVPDNTDLSADTPKNLLETERNTLLKIILGMAIDTYGYTPGASKNKTTGNNNGSIKASLQRVGLNADEKTISKYLLEAVDRYPEAKPSKLKP